MRRPAAPGGPRARFTLVSALAGTSRRVAVGRYPDSTRVVGFGAAALAGCL